MNAEKRRYKRISIEGLSGVFHFSTKARIINLSLGGAAVEVDRRLEMNSTYNLKIPSGDKFLEIKGRVVWCVLSGNQKTSKGDIVPIYHAGIKFIDLLDERAKMLLELIESHKAGISRFEERIRGIRFKIILPEKVVVDFPLQYKISVISLGGMLIELPEELPLDAVYPMQIEIPHDKTIIKFNGRIASCKKAHDRPEYYHMGVEFIEMNEDDRKKLNDFISSLEI